MTSCSWTLPLSQTACHTFSDSLPLERDVLYGRPLGVKMEICLLKNGHSRSWSAKFFPSPNSAPGLRPCQKPCYVLRARPNIDFGYGFGAKTAKLFGLGLVSVTAVTRFLVSVWFRLRRNSKVSFRIVAASRNSDIEFDKHRIILQPFYNAVSA